jgi:energy-coupling factor transporter ATP-binding protein EcfA2
MLFGKLMMQKPNILVMDEPTNHLDMESIESLNMALEMYQGTLIFVSHDREFVSSLATRVMEITPERVIDFSGNYEDYLRSKGIDNPCPFPGCGYALPGLHAVPFCPVGQRLTRPTVAWPEFNV